MRTREATMPHHRLKKIPGLVAFDLQKPFIHGRNGHHRPIGQSSVRILHIDAELDLLARPVVRPIRFEIHGSIVLGPPYLDIDDP